MGTDCKNWKGVLRPHGTVKLDSNGLMLLSFCAENDLTITNTLFRQADKYRTKWMHKDRNSGIRLTMPSVAAETSLTSEPPKRCGVGEKGGGGGGGRAECWTDHRLVRSILSLHINPTRRKTAKSCRPAFDTAKLKQLERSRMFAKDLDDRLTAHGPLSGPPPQQWEQFKTLVTESAKLTIGPKMKVHQDWLDVTD